MRPAPLAPAACYCTLDGRRNGKVSWRVNPKPLAISLGILRCNSAQPHFALTAPLGRGRLPTLAAGFSLVSCVSAFELGNATSLEGEHRPTSCQRSQPWPLAAHPSFSSCARRP